MKLNTKARYALSAMAAIADSNDAGEPLSVRSLGRRTQISRYYLGQLLTRLVAVGLLQSRRGRKGGYSLARSAGDISIGQIVNAVAGPINIVACIGQPEVCDFAEQCRCRTLYRALNQRITVALDAFTLADFARHQPRAVTSSSNARPCCSSSRRIGT